MIFNRPIIRIIAYVLPPVAISFYLFYPLLSGLYVYHNSEQGPYLSFMVNFIDALRHFQLPAWNEYVGGGHPAMYFAHYPVSQNTLVYMLFGFNDFTYYFTKFTSTIIIFLSFLVACRVFKIDYLTGLLGALVYFCINFVVRIIVAETIGNLIVLYPALVILAVHLVAESSRRQWQEILIFMLCFVFWLLGNNLTYVHIHAVMLSVVYWLAVFIYHGRPHIFPDLKKYVWLYFVMFVVPWIGALYQYYFVLDVVASCNRLKEGLIVSPLDPVVWKQLAVSIMSSSYIWIGILSLLIYVIVKRFSEHSIFVRINGVVQKAGLILPIGAAVLVLIITITQTKVTTNCALLSDYIPLLNSTVFRISSLIYILAAAFLKPKSECFPTWRDSITVIVYVSLLSYYFYSPDNINEVGPGNGYDYALFRELSVLTQAIFTISVLFAMESYRDNRIVKVMILSLIVLYFIRSHLSIAILRFTGVIWYATRDGSIFSAFFAVIFMFGLKNMIARFGRIPGLVRGPFRFFSKPDVGSCVKYGFLVFLVLLMVWDSYDKLYKGTSHRFVYPRAPSVARTPEEIRIIKARNEIVSLNQKLIELHKNSKHFYRLFTPENNIYLAGTLQDRGLYESVIYDSAISRGFQRFYDEVILDKKKSGSRSLKDVMPYHLFTSHFHKGVGFRHNEVSYRDFFVFSPADAQNLKNQNITFFWDLMQVQYLIVGAKFSEAINAFTNTGNNYRFLGHFPTLDLNIYEITGKKKYSTMAFLPLNGGSADELVDRMNSWDINELRSLYSRLVFPEIGRSDFKVLDDRRSRNERHYEIEADKEGILVEFESWNRNWKVTIDRNDAGKVLKAFHILKAVRIHKGRNSIDLSYDLKYFKVLFLVSVVTISSLVALLLLSFYSGNKGKS